MKIKLAYIVLFVCGVVLAACNSPEELERKNAEFQKKHFAGTSASGNPRYLRGVATKEHVKPESFFGAVTDESARNMPVSKLPRLTSESIPTRLFQQWCERDGYSAFRVTGTEHKGDFRVQVASWGRTYFPIYDVTAECTR
ncbi:hypothetical protein [uncultured Tateyamaria sp.]|uniref:hypothetical protein n=1 Tax=uncultured Tateyamaria sp. TaxID=455651 RepID=UPI002635BC7B|nr:hypothetical protein [uncultured Tateyamaria sp.]